MIVKGRTRGGGRQLASYLLSMGENEHVSLMYIDGQADVNEKDFRNLLSDFSLTEKLTRSRKGIYHATINPPEDFSRSMTNDDWMQSAKILARELGFSEQRMALVLHKKHGREHLHAVFERTNLETGKMVPISHNYRKHLKAGQAMSEIFGLQPVPERNPRRGTIKENLTRIWNETADAGSFIKEARKFGYGISKGYDRKPFLVIDETGQSFNLVRHIEGVKMQAVRERLKGSVLLEEREAIALVRNQQSITQKQIKQQVRESRNDFAEKLKQARTTKQTHKPRMR